jgi:hypothetical protein
MHSSVEPISILAVWPKMELLHNFLHLRLYCIDDPLEITVWGIIQQ